MDDRYFAVKAASKRIADLRLQSIWHLRLEVKFMRLLTILLKKAVSPSVQQDLTMYDQLTLLVEDMAAARNPYSLYIDLAFHLQTMIEALQGEEERDIAESGSITDEHLSLWGI
jgi:hypothetical protein